MAFSMLNEEHIRDLKLIVGKRLSTGDSNLELHAKDQSQHPRTRPEAVLWPCDRDEVSEILKYANVTMKVNKEAPITFQ